MSQTDHKAASARATAALLECVGRGEDLQAAIIRGAPPAEITAIRDAAQAHFEAYLDQMSEAATVVRQIIQG